MIVSVPYVPVKEPPALASVPDPSVPPILKVVTVKEELASTSVSLSSTKSLDPSVTVSVASSFTAPVSLFATGASFTPFTVMAMTAVSV